LHATRADAEIREAYGDRRYTPLGRAVAEARVTDADESMFLPAVYRVAAVRWLEGGSGALEEVVSFEGAFGGAADAGDRIVVTGHLELERAGGRRLVVGSGFLPDGGTLRVVR
jgi:predicted nucleotidyltransferase